MRQAFCLICTVALLSACSGFSNSAANPANWFGGRNSAPDTLVPEGGFGLAISDTRPLVSEITELTVEATPGGIILRATGLPPAQGYWDVNLVRLPRDAQPEGALVYEFKARPPVTPTGGGGVRTREVTAAAFVSNTELTGIRRLTVNAETNSRTRSR